MIMESANLHHQHHQLQENLLVVGSSSSSSSSSSSLLPTPSSSSCYALGTKHSNWTPTTTTTTLSNNSGNSSSSSLDLLNTSMAPDLGFQWLTNLTTHHHSPHDLAKIKEELSASSSSTSSDHHPHNSFPKLTEMLTSTSSIDHDEYFQFIKNEENNNNNNIDNNQVMMNDLSDKLLLKTLSSSAGDHQFYSNHHHHHHHLLSNSNLTAGVQAMMPSSRSAGHFSQIYPSINISNLNRTLASSTLSSSTSSLDMNLQAMDLLGSNSARFGTHNHQLNSHADTLGSYIEQMHQTADRHYRLSASNKISTFDNEVITEVKRPGSSIEPKVAQAAAPKKSRLESRTSCPPFKVRKEKLGDRIAALQQLVAPFGKTDTASVLMEAIGYIKFLQNQVETLSVPYMKMSRNKSCKTMQRGMIEMSGNGETSKRDLRSRGLCLVPLSCMSYVTGDIGGGSGGGSGGNVWPTADFGGGI